jgi:hypothetical protein
MTIYQHDNSPTWQFTNLAICRFDSSPTRQFANMTICRHHNSPTGEFTQLTICQHDNSLIWHFADITICQHDNSPTWQFTNMTIHQHDNSPTWQFAALTICQHDNSVSSTTHRYVNSSTDISDTSFTLFIFNGTVIHVIQWRLSDQDYHGLFRIGCIRHDGLAQPFVTRRLRQLSPSYVGGHVLFQKGLFTWTMIFLSCATRSDTRIGFLIILSGITRHSVTQKSLF